MKIFTFRSLTSSFHLASALTSTLLSNLLFTFLISSLYLLRTQHACFQPSNDRERVRECDLSRNLRATLSLCSLRCLSFHLSFHSLKLVASLRVRRKERALRKSRFSSLRLSFSLSQVVNTLPKTIDRQVGRMRSDWMK